MARFDVERVNHLHQEIKAVRRKELELPLGDVLERLAQEVLLLRDEVERAPGMKPLNVASMPTVEYSDSRRANRRS